MAPIEIHGLTKRFGAVLAVDQVSFEVAAGTVTGFLGPNGAGKTTTLRMLLGLVEPTAGTATINGRPYRQLSNRAHQVAPRWRPSVRTRAVAAAGVAAWRRRPTVGMIIAGWQSLGLFAMSFVADNLRSGHPGLIISTIGYVAALAVSVGTGVLEFIVNRRTAHHSVPKS